MRRTDLVAGALFAAVAALALVWFIPAYTAPAQSRLDLPPALMPSLAMAVLLATAVLLFWTGLPRRAAAEEEHEEFGGEASGIGRHELLNFGLWLAAAAVTFALLHAVGFVIAGIVLLAAAMLFARMDNPWLLGGLALAVPVALDRIVWFAFTIVLP